MLRRRSCALWQRIALFVAASIVNLSIVHAQGKVPSFDMASYTITQDALTEAPTRYGSIVQDVVKKANSVQFPAQSQNPGGCHGIYYDITPNGDNTLAIVPGTLSLTIAASNTLTIKARLTGKVPMHAHIWSERKELLFFCIHATVCNNNVEVGVDLSLTINAKVSYDAKSGGLVVDVPPANVIVGWVTQPTIQGCHPDGWVTWFDSDWHSQLTSAVASHIQSFASAFATKYNAPQTFSPFQLTYVSYKVTGLLWYAGSSVTFSSSGSLKATVNGVNQTYMARSDYANVMPPMSPWPAKQDGDPDSHFLVGMRASSTLLSALMWVSDVAAHTTFEGQHIVLDSKVNLTMAYAAPLVGVPENSILQLNVTSGFISALCHPVNGSSNRHHWNTILDIGFTDLIGSGTVTWNKTADDDKGGLTIQVRSFDESELHTMPFKPPLMLPLSFEHSIMTNAIRSLIPAMNRWLLYNPFILPSNLEPYVINPQVSVVHQVSGSVLDVGYLEVDQYCSCDTSQHTFGHCDSSVCKSSRALFETKPISRVVQSGDASVVPSSRRNLLDATVNADTTVDEGLIVTLYQGAECAVGAGVAGSAAVYSAPNSGGKCVSMSQDLDLYYSIDVAEQRALLFCSDSACSTCTVNVTDTTNDLCIPAGSNSSVVIGQPCIHKTTGEGNDLVITTYGSATDCQQTVLIGDAQWLSTIQNIGPADGRCRLSSDGVTYSQVSETKEPTSAYSLLLRCVFDNCTSCGLTIPTIEDGSCYQQRVSIAHEDSFSSCTTLHSRSSTTTIIIAVCVGIPCGLVIIFAATLCFRRRKGLSTATGDDADNDAGKKLPQSRLGHGSQITMASSVMSTARWAGKGITFALAFVYMLTGKGTKLLARWGRIKRQAVRLWWRRSIGCRSEWCWDDIIDNALMLACAAVGIVMARVFLMNGDPFSMFQTSNLLSLGLPMQYFDPEAMDTYFTRMKLALVVVTAVSGVAPCLFLVFGFLVTKSEDRVGWWSLTRAKVLVFAFVMIFVTNTIPTVSFSFDALLVMVPNTGVWLSDNEAALTDTNMVIGASVTGLTIAMTTLNVLILMHSVGVGVYCGVTTFMLTYYRLWSRDNVMFLRVRTVVRLMLIMPLFQALISLHPAVLFSQDAGRSASFLISLVAIWMLPTTMGMHLCYSVLAKRFDEYGNPVDVFASRSHGKDLFHIVTNALVTFGIFAGLTVSITDHDLLTKTVSKTFVGVVMLATFVWSFAAVLMLMKHVVFAPDSVLKVMDVLDGVDWTGTKNVNKTRVPIILEPTEHAYATQRVPLRDRIKRCFGVVGYASRYIFGCMRVVCLGGIISCWRKRKGLPRSFRRVGYMCVQFVLENDEYKLPHYYGWKVRFRRAFLMVGLGCLTRVVVHRLTVAKHFSARSELNDVFTDIGWAVQWPNNATIFADAFKTFDRAEWDQAIALTVSCVFFWTAFVFDVANFTIGYSFKDTRRMLAWKHATLALSRSCVFAGALVIFVVVIVLAAPSYLKETRLSDICPFCGKTFNHAVTEVSNLMIGLVCALLFTAELLPMLLAMAPGLVRAAVLMMIHPAMQAPRPDKNDVGEKSLHCNNEDVPALHDGGSLVSPLLLDSGGAGGGYGDGDNGGTPTNDNEAELSDGDSDDNNDDHEDLDQARSMLSSLSGSKRGKRKVSIVEYIGDDAQPLRVSALKAIALSSAVLVYPITALALGLLHQFQGSSLTQFLIFAFWTVPPCVLFFGLMPTLSSEKDSSRLLQAYIGYLISYFGLLMAVLVNTLASMHQLGLLEKYLKNRLMWFEIFAELTLGSVAISDALYTAMFSQVSPVAATVAVSNARDCEMSVTTMSDRDRQDAASRPGQPLRASILSAMSDATMTSAVSGGAMSVNAASVNATTKHYVPPVISSSS